jgi:hypothetical protein
VRGCASNFSNSNLCSTSDDSTTPCFTCDDDYCNVILYPSSGRLQCYSCSGDNCELSEDSVKYCSVYGSNEKCVTVFSQTEDRVASRGCSSEVDYQQVCDNSAGNCVQCAYDKCNVDESKAKSYKCIGCKSIDDPNCVTGNAITARGCATNECYARTFYADVDDGRSGLIVERGCLADLTAISVPCTGTSCSSCTGSNCNNAKFPADRISCKSCVGLSCLSHTLNEKVCSFYTTNEACITVYDTDTSEPIYRDCYADAPQMTKDLCDDPSNLECSKCTTSNCNIDTARRGSKCFKCSGIECFNPTLANIQDCQSSCYVGVNQMGQTVRDCTSSTLTCGDNDSNCLACDEDFCNGITFPTQSRRSCLFCSGNDCTSEWQSKYCEVYGSSERCVTVYDSSSKVTEKGCSSSLSQANVTSSSSCSFDNCNVDASTADVGVCISCNSQNDINCITNPLESGLTSCRSNDCYSQVLDTGVVERGCGATLTTTCSGDNCAKCTGSRCNSLSIPANRQSCYKCSGSDCVHGLGRVETCLGARSDGCITIFDDDSQAVYRNCYSDVNTVIQSLCDDSTNLECSKCTTSNCNTDGVRRGSKCFKCNGPECFNPTLANIQNCQSSCYVGVNQNGETVRDCASSSLPCSGNAANCLICSDDFCNGITFPTANRRSCLQCSGDECSTSSESNYCKVFGSAESCVTIFDSVSKVIERGCSSSIASSNTTTNKLNCNFDNCNTQNAMSEAYYCIACNSENDRRCILSPSDTSSVACTTNDCFSRALDSGVVERGCGAALTTCTSDNCLKCNGTRCNIDEVPRNRQSCYKCSGNSCLSANFGTIETCLTHTSNSCVTIFGEDSRPIYRNCYSDVNEIVQSLCDDSSNIDCVKCNTKNCNMQTSRTGSKCFKCNGPECFTPALPDVVDCKSSCYVGVNQRGETVRDCTSTTLTCADSATNCMACTGDYCNGITFPTVNRRSCLQCSGTNCLNSQNSNFCNVFSSSESCVTVFDSASNVIERGCSSSLTSANTTNKLTCTFDNCNTHRSLSETFYCISCDSENDIRCITSPKETQTATCTTNECFSRVMGNGVVQRGCGTSFTATCTGDSCIKCTGSQCNSVDVPSNRHSCLKCSGPSCANNTAVIETCLSVTNNRCVTIFGEGMKVFNG